jgi:hypothetical protein
LFSAAVSADRANQLLRDGAVRPMRSVDEVLLDYPRVAGRKK